MSTSYANAVRMQAFKDIEAIGRISAITADALERLGYSASAIVQLERQLLSRSK